MGTFLAKITPKDGYGFWGLSGTPLSNSNVSTPPTECTQPTYLVGTPDVTLMASVTYGLKPRKLSGGIAVHLPRDNN